MDNRIVRPKSIAMPSAADRLYQALSTNSSRTARGPDRRIARADEILENVRGSPATDHANAERQLQEVQVILSADWTPEARATKSDALILLANKRRDRGRISGQSGAYALYTSSGALIEDRNETRRKTELLLFKASCLEMSGLNDLALEKFGEACVSSSSGQDWYNSWAHFRVATNLVKLGELEQALQEIQLSLANPVSDTDIVWNSVQRMKRASLGIAMSEIDLALRDASEASSALSTAGSLLVVRSSIQYADALMASGDIDEGIRVLSRAESISHEEGYVHQLHSVSRLIDKHTGPSSQSSPRLIVATFKPLTREEADRLD